MNRVTLLFSRAGLLAAGLAAQACADGAQEVPVPGTAVVSLSSANADGAILLRVTGPGFTGTPVSAGSSTKLYWRQVSEEEIMVALFGTISAGALFQVAIPDVGAAAQYAGTILDVADRADDQRTELGGYGVEVGVAR
jgi:hypothetical protein